MAAGACSRSGSGLAGRARFRAALARRSRGRSSRRRVRGRAGIVEGGRPSAPRMWAGGSGRSHVRSGTVGGPHGGGGAQWSFPLEPERAEGATETIMGTAAGIRAPTTSPTTATTGPTRQLLPSLFLRFDLLGLAGLPRRLAVLLDVAVLTPPCRPTRPGTTPMDTTSAHTARAAMCIPPTTTRTTPRLRRIPTTTAHATPRRRRAVAVVLPSFCRGESGQLRLEVRPEDTSVYVDDEFRGAAAEARQLDSGPRATHDRAGPSGLRASNAIRSTS